MPSEATDELLEYDLFEKWWNNYYLSDLHLKQITELNFYYFLAQAVAQWIRDKLKRECICKGNTVCLKCWKLLPFSIDFSKDVLRKELCEAISSVKLEEVKKEVEMKVGSIDESHLESLSVKVWRTRREIRELEENVSPFFRLRTRDKTRAIDELTSEIFKICEDAPQKPEDAALGFYTDTLSDSTSGYLTDDHYHDDNSDCESCQRLIDSDSDYDICGRFDTNQIGDTSWRELRNPFDIQIPN